MDKFDTGSQADMPFALVIAEPGRTQREHGAEALSARRDDMAGELRDQQDRALHLLQDDLVDSRHIGNRKIAQSVQRRRISVFKFVIKIDNDSHCNPLPRLIDGAGTASIGHSAAGSSDPASYTQMRAMIRQFKGMKELVRTNNTVLLSWLQSLLRQEGIESFVFDSHMSVLEGSANAIARRLMVIDDDYDKARETKTEAGEGQYLV